MRIIRRNNLRRSGFAGLRETRMVMSPRVFRDQVEAGTSSGIGRFVYLADASFLPNGDTRMHDHKEIDVISIMMAGRIKHEGSLEHGQELIPGSIQVQRAGGEGFSHNEINPDDSKNRMIQLWVLPETPDEPADYKMYEAADSGRTRIYGGPAEQQETLPARTVVEVAQIKKGEILEQPGRCIIYVSSGAGSSLEETLREGYLVETSNFRIKALADTKLIIIHEQ
jgi:redox-sensitive bicupin YhaK (pirin superfamily)